MENDINEFPITNLTLPGGLTATQCQPNGTSTKRPVLLCHGRMSGAWQWARLQPFLARRGHASLAINYRGHCGSAPVADLASVGLADFLADARSAAETLGRPIAIGQSTGGLVVQKLAEAGEVCVAVLSCSVPPAGILGYTATTAEVSDDLRHQVVQPDRADFDEHIYNRMSEALADEAFAQQVPESGRMIAELLHQSIDVDEHQVTCPVLSVIGGDDRQVPLEVGLALAAKYGALSVVRPHAGHYALIYEPGWEHTADMVVDWLDRVVP